MQYIVPIIALFHGRVIDIPGQAMGKTMYSTEGEIEHEVSHLITINQFLPEAVGEYSRFL
jgi:hypothetical protein